MGVFKPYKFYTKDEIEQQANDVLRQMEAKYFTPKWPLDTTEVADYLELYVFWRSISADEDGIIAAKIEPLKRRIVLNEDFPGLKRQDRGFEQSTIAHEIGHWILHVNQDEVDGTAKQLFLPGLALDTELQSFVCRTVNERIPNSTRIRSKYTESIEWQAQYFASCLLMPQFKLEEVRKGRDLTKWPHLYAMKDELGVTISNLTNRLKDLGWIYIPNGSKQIYLNEKSQDGQRKLF